MSTSAERKAAFDGMMDKVLTPLAEPLAKILAPIIKRAQAEAWDQGYGTGVIDQSRWEKDGIPDGGVRNPYREET